MVAQVQRTIRTALLLLALVAAVTAVAAITSDAMTPEPPPVSAQDSDDGVTNLDDSESSLVTPLILFGLLHVAAITAIVLLVVYRQRRHHKPQQDPQEPPLTSRSERESEERIPRPR